MMGIHFPALVSKAKCQYLHLEADFLKLQTLLQYWPEFSYPLLKKGINLFMNKD
jgi:hypothetical protein